ncbi:unnamed protein product [Amoebophrya sp. A25]|nr:unnamed protein product [Amoebophrya sp. A25]|eukprot:GSA25T00021763001.1
MLLSQSAGTQGSSRARGVVHHSGMMMTSTPIPWMLLILLCSLESAFLTSSVFFVAASDYHFHMWRRFPYVNGKYDGTLAVKLPGAQYKLESEFTFSLGNGEDRKDLSGNFSTQLQWEHVEHILLPQFNAFEYHAGYNITGPVTKTIVPSLAPLPNGTANVGEPYRAVNFTVPITWYFEYKENAEDYFQQDDYVMMTFGGWSESYDPRVGYSTWKFDPYGTGAYQKDLQECENSKTTCASSYKVPNGVLPGIENATDLHLVRYHVAFPDGETPTPLPEVVSNPEMREYALAAEISATVNLTLKAWQELRLGSTKLALFLEETCYKGLLLYTKFPAYKYFNRVLGYSVSPLDSEALPFVHQLVTRCGVGPFTKFYNATLPNINAAGVPTEVQTYLEENAWKGLQLMGFYDTRPDYISYLRTNPFTFEEMVGGERRKFLVYRDRYIVYTTPAGADPMTVSFEATFTQPLHSVPALSATVVAYNPLTFCKGGEALLFPHKSPYSRGNKCVPTVVAFPNTFPKTAPRDTFSLQLFNQTAYTGSCKDRALDPAWVKYEQEGTGEPMFTWSSSHKVGECLKMRDPTMGNDTYFYLQVHECHSGGLLRMSMGRSPHECTTRGKWYDYGEGCWSRSDVDALDYMINPRNLHAKVEPQRRHHYFYTCGSDVKTVTTTTVAFTRKTGSLSAAFCAADSIETTRKILQAACLAEAESVMESPTVSKSCAVTIKSCAPAASLLQRRSLAVENEEAEETTTRRALTSATDNYIAEAEYTASYSSETGGTNATGFYANAHLAAVNNSGETAFSAALVMQLYAQTATMDNTTALGAYVANTGELALSLAFARVAAATSVSVPPALASSAVRGTPSEIGGGSGEPVDLSGSGEPVGLPRPTSSSTSTDDKDIVDESWFLPVVIAVGAVVLLGLFVAVAMVSGTGSGKGKAEGGNSNKAGGGGPPTKSASAESSAPDHGTASALNTTAQASASPEQVKVTVAEHDWDCEP